MMTQDEAVRDITLHLLAELKSTYDAVITIAYDSQRKEQIEAWEEEDRKDLQGKIDLVNKRLGLNITMDEL